MPKLKCAFTMDLHFRNIFKEQELEENSTTEESSVVHKKSIP